MTYLVHASNKSIIRRGIIFGGDDDAVTLGRGHVDSLSIGGLRVDTVYFYDTHSVAFEPNVLSGKSAYVDQAEHVSPARTHLKGEVLSIIHQSSVGDGLCSSGIGDTDETLHKVGNPVMIPVRKGEDNFLVIVILERAVRVSDDERPSQSIRVLPTIVGMIPRIPSTLLFPELKMITHQ